MPVVAATAASLRGYGRLVDDPKDCKVEIVRWPATGRRPIDADTGDQGGTTEGVFVSEWQGDILYGRNEAVGGHYILAYAAPPSKRAPTIASNPAACCCGTPTTTPTAGSSSFRSSSGPFLVPLAPPGDDVTPGALRLLSLRRPTGSVHPPGHLARGRVRRERDPAFLRPAGCGACACLGRLRARVRLPSRGDHRPRCRQPFVMTGTDPSGRPRRPENRRSRRSPAGRERRPAGRQ